jgi:hypothetical protein
MTTSCIVREIQLRSPPPGQKAAPTRPHAAWRRLLRTYPRAALILPSAGLEPCNSAGRSSTRLEGQSACGRSRPFAGDSIDDRSWRRLGIVRLTGSDGFLSRSVRSAPEGNAGAERFIRTLKENPLWVRHFETIEELRLALLAFREAYNTTWLIERHGFVSPAAFRQRQLQPIAKAA